MSDELSVTIDKTFRSERGKVISSLTRHFGLIYLDLIENAVQEAFIKALDTWPYKGIPDNPKAWLAFVAKNKVIDELRKDKHLSFGINENLVESTSYKADDHQDETAFLNDDLLKMLFLCCHESLNTLSQLVLTLKIVCGFNIKQISKALLMGDEAIRKTITRSKLKLRSEKAKFDLPAKGEINTKLHIILDVIYLIFNEGYITDVISQELGKSFCFDAIRLCEMIVQLEEINLEAVYALLALMYLQISRFETRVDENYQLTKLEDQDRSKWDQALIASGMRYLSKSAQGNKISRYHLEAAIAACHCIAKSYEDTDWKEILNYYDQLLRLSPSPIIKLNRAVSVLKAQGPHEALLCLKELEQEKSMQHYYLLSAVIAECYTELNQKALAEKYYLNAIKLAESYPEKQILQKSLNLLKDS